MVVQSLSSRIKTSHTDYIQNLHGKNSQDKIYRVKVNTHKLQQTNFYEIDVKQHKKHRFKITW